MKKWLDKYNDDIPQAQLGKMLAPITGDDVAKFFDMFSVPQKAVTKMVTGKYQTPSEAMNIKNPVGAFATDMVLDPVNLVGAGAVKATGAYKNAYKYNPWRFKANPEAYYHRSPNLENIINQETGMLQGFGESQAGKILTESVTPIGGGISLKKGANSKLYFAKGTPLDWGRTNMILDEKTGKMIPGQGYPGPYMAEVKGVPMGASAKGRAPGPEPTKIGSYAVSKRPISVDETKFYKEDWLRGYKEIKPPKKKENGGWLDKYDTPKAQNGIEGTMGGLTDVGFNYNGAWGGTMQMGGSIPGAVGFTYARTGSIPSNGPYAKKTKASAQDGKKVSYNQWKKQYNLKETPDYNLKRAWELGYTPDKTGHLPTVDNQTGQFLKAKGHPTLQLELDWYNSPEGADFRSKNAIDSSGKFFKYVPKGQNGMEMKFYQEGLDFKPKTISQDGTSVKKPRTDMLTMDEYRLQQALANQPVVQPALKTGQLSEEEIKRRNKAYAQQTGKKFDEKTGKVSPRFSPQQEKTLKKIEENIVEPALTIGDVMAGAALTKPLTKALGKKALSTFVDPERLPSIPRNVRINTIDEFYDRTQDWARSAKIDIDSYRGNLMRRFEDIGTRYGLDVMNPDIRDRLRNLPAATKSGFLTEIHTSLPRRLRRNDFESSQPSFFTREVETSTNLTNRSGLTKQQVLEKAPVKDKEVLSKMTDDQFRETVVKPTGEVVPYIESTNFSDLQASQPLSKEEYSQAFNSKLDLLNSIIAKNNRSGVNFQIQGLDPAGKLTFYTPGGQVVKHSVIKGKNFREIMETDIRDFFRGKKTVVPEGTRTWNTGIVPGKFSGEVEDIANANYYKEIPGMAMINTSSGIFPDDVVRRGTGAYESINEYLKQMSLGRVKPGFNSQTQYSKGLWENAIKKGKAFGYYNNPRTVYGSMKSLLPYAGLGGLGAAALEQKREGGEITVDPMGYWNPDNVGEPVIIPSNVITMEGVDQPLIGISDTGDVQYMEPGEDYTFDGEYVTEYPMMQQGGRTPMYVDKPNDPRLKAYQDSLRLYNQYKKDVVNRGSNDLEESFKTNDPLISDLIKLHGIDKSKIKPIRIDQYNSGYSGAGTAFVPVYKKPVQPVQYKKPEQKKDKFGLTKEDYIQARKTEWIPTPGNDKGDGYYKLKKDGKSYKVYTQSGGNSWVDVPSKPAPVKKTAPPKLQQSEPIRKIEQPKPVEIKQNVYEGSPVYSGNVGSGGPSALVGFVNQKGDTTYIKPEDYERFGVPKYGKEFIQNRKKQRNGGVNEADAQPIEKLDQLLNFTNYNKPTKGGWLDKYN